MDATRPRARRPRVRGVGEDDQSDRFVVAVDDDEDDEDDDRGARLQTKPTAAVVDDEPEPGKRH